VSRIITYDIRAIQQEARVAAYTKARSEGKSEEEAQNISAAVGNNVGAAELAKLDIETESSGSAPAPRDEETSERKTDTPSAGETSTSPDSGAINTTFSKAGGSKFQAATEKNILNNYRSWTYNFALSAISAQALSNPRLIEGDMKRFPVLNSAGKGTAGIAVSQGGDNRTAGNLKNTTGLVDGFNKNSPGRFDMYIDNVEIESFLGAGTTGTGSSTPTNIKFDVYEPYSMNGLIEAMQVAAKAAGYSDYIKGVYALRVQFQGYPDSATDAQMRSEIIPMSTRYFTITMTQVDVDVNEQGTRYKIEAAPTSKMAMGLPNKLTSDIKVAGDTVGEVLKNFFDAINDMTEGRMETERGNGKRKPCDTYEISCPKMSTVGSPQNTKAAILKGTTGTNYTSDIIKAKMLDELKSSEVFQMGDPAKFKNGYVGTTSNSTATNASSNPSTGKLNPKTSTVVFSQGQQIHDCIAAIVRDSEYTRDLLKPENLKKVKQGNGYITYFTVRTELDFLPGFDDANNKNYINYRYVLEPYQIHYSTIPGQQLGKVDLKDIKGKIKREYNYIYTGKNVDVLKFSLKFDNLYFSAMPALMGNREAVNQTANAAAPNNQTNANKESAPATRDNANAGENSVPLSPTGTSQTANSYQNESARAGLPQGDPYALMAKNLHQAVLNNVGLITGKLEILGDPYFLVTGGMFNGDLVLKDPKMTVDGQAPITQGDLYVNINFRNPIDINSTTGLADFGKAPVAFSGVYRTLTLTSSFRGGVFTQNIDVMRMEGQIVGKESEILAPDGKTTPTPGQQVIKDTALASVLRSGIRPSDFNLNNLLQRGLPSVGLPGGVSNFTNSLSAGASSVSGLLNQVGGAAGQVSQLANQLGVSPIGGINALTSGIRLSAAGLGALSSIPNLAAATVSAAGSAIGNIANIPNAAVKLAGNTVNSIAALPSTLASAAQSNPLVQNVTGLATQAFGQVSGLIGNAKNAVTGLQNPIPTDFASVGSKLGIDTSALAGLSPELASKMATELTQVSKEIPPNTDLGGLKEQGIAFANISRDKLPNLPALQPKVSAPAALSDPASAEAIASRFGSLNPLLGGKANLSSLTDLNKVTNPLGGLTAGANGILQNSRSLIGSVSAANSYVNNTIGSAAGIANGVGSLSQNAITGFSPASIGLGSVESNLNTVNNLAQVSQRNTNLGISVASQFGSLQSSPLTKLVRDSNIEGSV
jgi:hypothetical protein